MEKEKQELKAIDAKGLEIAFAVFCDQNKHVIEAYETLKRARQLTVNLPEESGSKATEQPPKETTQVKKEPKK